MAWLALAGVIVVVICGYLFLDFQHNVQRDRGTIASSTSAFEPPSSSAPATSDCSPQQFRWVSIRSPEANDSAFRIIDGKAVEIRNPYDPYATSTTLIGADPATFWTWSNWYDDIAKDATHVYGEGKVIPTAQPDSFTPLSDRGSAIETYAEDGMNVFHHDLLGWSVVTGADPHSFVVLPKIDQTSYIKDCYFDAADNAHLYYSGSLANCS